MNTAIIRAFGAFNAWVYRLTGSRVLGRLARDAPIPLAMCQAASEMP